MTDAPLLEVKGLVKHYPLKRGVLDKLTKQPELAVRAVDGVDFTMERGRVLRGLLGPQLLDTIPESYPTSGHDEVWCKWRPWLRVS